MTSGNEHQPMGAETLTVWVSRAPGVEIIDADRTVTGPPGDTQTWTISPGSELSFGRAAEITLGDNPYLHRSLGRFSYRSDRDTGPGWRIQNDGARTALTIDDASDPVNPGQEATLGLRGRVQFVAGSEHYELRYLVEVDHIELVAPPLGRRHQRVLLALCEPRLRRPDAPRVLIPSVSQISSRLALSLSQVNECLNGLTDTYRSASASASGATADDPTAGTDERGSLEALVRWAVATGMVTTAQLDSLNTPVTQIERRP